LIRCLTKLPRSHKKIMKHVPTVSICIPAFNEEKNIQRLLNCLLRQKQLNFRLKEIIVISDGSTDKTTDVVKALQNPLVRVIDSPQRTGKTARLNQLFSLFSGDILFLLDADIFISNTTLFSSLISKANFPRDGLISVQPRPVPAKNFFEASINYSVAMQNELRSRWNGGRNYLAFRGNFLGLDAPFAKSISLHPNLISQDAYLYFLAKERGYKTKHIDSLFIHYTSPDNFQDHCNQSLRHSESYKELDMFLSQERSHHRYTPHSIYMYTLIPLSLFIRVVVKYLCLNPVYFLSYCSISVAVKVKRKVSVSFLWDQAISTKNTIT
jgi:glycosyltransferase involved in cell wall biosynthesis